jgi:hypothetical protein
LQQCCARNVDNGGKKKQTCQNKSLTDEVEEMWRKETSLELGEAGGRARGGNRVIAAVLYWTLAEELSLGFSTL